MKNFYPNRFIDVEERIRRNLSSWVPLEVRAQRRIINYYFKWEGPSYSLDTACSSSAASIQLACTALIAREIDTAVAGGANILTASDLFAGLSRGGFLSPTGGCKTFDDAADGYCRADAVGVVVLKRLCDAVADNDNILSVIKAVATNHSAHAISITHPHSATQQKLFKKVVAKSGLLPTDVNYVELHGTGTQAGDFTEFSSITSVFAKDRRPDEPLYIGTVKPNLGHGEAASGVTSLIKAIMMLERNVIPPHVGIKGKINRRLPPLEPLGVRLAATKVSWPLLTDKKRRIVINNFDAAGGNTSMLIEDPPNKSPSGVDPRTNHVVTVSGRTPNALKQNQARLLQFVKDTPVDLADLAYTTTARRQHHGYRTGYSCSRIHDLLTLLDKDVKNGQEPIRVAKGSIVFTFTGQGSQFSGMSHQLYRTNRFCRELFQEYDAICVRQNLPSFLKLISNDKCSYHSATPAEIQLAIVATELVMASLWQSWGISPDKVIGHSLGEYPGLVIAGVLSVSDMLYLVGKRALLMQEKCSEGTHSMLAIKLSVSETKQILDSRPDLLCEVACINSPTSTVVSGSTANIAILQQALVASGKKTSLLDVRFAFHSAQMDEVLPFFSRIAESVQFQAPIVPFASPLRGAVVKEAGVFNAQYLTEQCRGTVNFVKALEVAKEQLPSIDDTLWIDFGPQPFCLSMAQATLTLATSNLVPTSKKDANDWTTVSEGLSAVYNKGFDVSWNQLHKEYERCLQLLKLPSYAFDLKNYWLQYEGDWSLTKGHKDILSASNGINSSFKPTPSLQQLDSENSTEDGTTFVFASNLADPSLRAAIRGHLVNGIGLCPSSIYADMAMSAGNYIYTKSQPGEVTQGMQVVDMDVSKPLVADTREGIDQWLRVTVISRKATSGLEITYSSFSDSIEVKHAHCSLKFGDGKKWMANWSRNAYLINGRVEKLVGGVEDGRTHKILRKMVYKLFSVLVAYGPTYQGLGKVYLDSDAFEAAGFVNFQTTPAEENFFFSPYWIDSLLHLSGFVLNGSDATPDDVVYISHGWKNFSMAKPLTSTGKYTVYVRMQPTDAKGVLAGDVYVMEGDDIVLVCTGLKFQQIKRTLLSKVLKPQVEAANRTSQVRLQSSNKQHLTIAKGFGVPVKRTRGLFDDVLALIAEEAEIEISELVDGAHLAELGVDSLLALGMVDKLRAIVDITVPASVFIDYPTVGKLRAFLGTSVASSTHEDDVSDESDEFGGTSSPNSSNVSVVEASVQDKTSFSQMLKTILVEELGIEVSEVQDSTSFEEIGVDSLMTSIIINEVRQQAGVTLPATYFFDHPTFGDVLRLDEKKQKSAQIVPGSTLEQRLKSIDEPELVHAFESSIVLLQGTTGASPAFFLFPDGSGSASSYTSLPSLSASSRPVYGLNSPFISSPTNFTASHTIQSVVSIYLAAIRIEQPQGPYLLGGWSIGGVYAYEAARQLLLLGETVSGVILIDSPCPLVLPPVSEDTIDILERVGIFDKVSKNGSGIPENMRQHFHASVRALKAYQPQSLPSSSKPISSLAIWAREGVLESTDTAKLSTRNSSTNSKNNATSDWLLNKRDNHTSWGWEKLFGRETRVEVVDGNHFTMMRQPAIKGLANAISRELERLS